MVTEAQILNGVRTELRARRLRAEVFGSGMEDGAWTTVLYLFAASLDPRPVGITALYRYSGVPATTASRVLARLIETGLVERRADPVDGRRSFAALTPSACELMRGYWVRLLGGD